MPIRRLLRLAGTGPTRAPNDQFAIEKNVACWQIRIRESIQHNTQSNSANISARLVLSRQRNRQQARVAHIINTGHANVFRDPQAEIQKRVHQDSGSMIIRAEECIWTVLL